MSMGTGTEILALFGVFGSILCADSMLDSPVAFFMAVGALVSLAWIGRNINE